MSFIQDIAAQKAVMLAALVAAILNLALPEKAHAQSVTDIVTDVAKVTGVLPRGCNVGGAVYRADCYARHVERRTDQHRNARQRRASETTRRMRQQMQQKSALTRACNMGDRASCARVRQLNMQVDERTYQLARALLDACRAGDRASCARLGG